MLPAFSGPCTCGRGSLHRRPGVFASPALILTRAREWSGRTEVGARATRLAKWVGNSSRNSSCAGPFGDLPGARSASDSSWKAGGSGIWPGRLLLPDRSGGAELGGDRQPGCRPAARQEGGTVRKRNGYYFFFLVGLWLLLKIAGPEQRGRRVFLSAVADPGGTRS